MEIPARNPGEHVDAEDDPPDRDAGDPRGLPIAADGDHVAAVAGSVEDDPPEDRDRQEHEDRDRDPEDPADAEPQQRERARVAERAPFRSSRLTGSLSFSNRASPLAMENIASVAMNGTTRPYAMAVALHVPRKVANRIAARMNTRLLVPSVPTMIPPKTPAPRRSTRPRGRSRPSRSRTSCRWPARRPRSTGSACCGCCPRSETCPASGSRRRRRGARRRSRGAYSWNSRALARPSAPRQVWAVSVIRPPRRDRGHRWERPRGEAGLARSRPCRRPPRRSRLRA